MLKIVDLTKSYQVGERHNVVLNSISFSVCHEDFTVIMGKSGSGKSTLLFSVSLLDSIDAGAISFDDVRLDLLNEKELSRIRLNDFGFVFQNNNLIEIMTLFENVALPAIERKSFDKQKVTDIMASLELDDCLDKLPGYCSGGERQRCAIARALVNGPRVLFADEPTGALDYHSTITLMEILKKLNEEGQTMLVVSHDRLVASYAKKVMYLKDGKILEGLSFSDESHAQRLRMIDTLIDRMD